MGNCTVVAGPMGRKSSRRKHHCRLQQALLRSDAPTSLQSGCMQRDPFFSIIIPTYNRARYVVEAVESVLAQTLEGVELIVVDDGSEDETHRALVPYSERVRLIRQENAGMASARNRGASEARGEFIGFLDSDDRWEPTLLETVRRALDEHPEVGALFVAEREFDDTGRVGTKVFTKRTPGLFFTSDGLVGRDTRVGSGRPAICRRDLFEHLGGYDPSLPGTWDCDLWIRYSFLATMMLVPEPLVRRRIHPGMNSANQLLDADGWLQLLDKLEKEHPEFVRAHPGTYRRTRAKNLLRRGRELLVGCAREPELAAQARESLRASIKGAPFAPRAWLYLAISRVAPGSYAGWRRHELRRRLS